MGTLKEKLLTLIGGGLMMGGAGLVKGLSKSLSHDSHLVSKMGSMHFERHTSDVHYSGPRKSVAQGEKSIVTTLTPGVVRTTVHHLPSWEEISGGAEPLVVSPIASVHAEVQEPYLPPYVDLRPWDNPITSQGSEGSCTAYATVAAMENELNQKFEGSVKLSEQSLWSMYKKPKLTTAIQSAMGESRTYVRLHSYNGSVLKDSDFIAYIDNPAAPMQIRNTREILALLAENHPVILSTEVNESFDQGTTGWIDIHSPNTNGAHAVTVVGYSLDPANPNLSYFIVRNSWGTRWGDKGYGYLPIAYCWKFYCAGYAVKNVRLERLRDMNKAVSATNSVKLPIITTP